MVRRNPAAAWVPGLIGILVMSATPPLARADGINAFVQTNLVSDIPGLAAHTDSNLVNPWGIAFTPTSPFWISDNHTGLSTLYNGGGTPLGLVVTIPPPGGGSPPAAPTGAVFNGSSSSSFNHDLFLFATEDGTIAGWRGALGTTAELLVDNSGAVAVYKGIALGTNGSGDMLYAANFNAGTIDVFNSSFVPVTPSGGFLDPTLPAGYAPFNIENIGGKLYVTYAQQDAAKHDDVAGPGHGFVDVFDTDGNLMERLVSGGALNSPWGMALAPAGFGPFGNDLLIGNFGDGTINAFDPSTGTLLGTLEDGMGNPIVNKGLWGMQFGNNGPGFDPHALYFTAGIPGDGLVEDHGLFGELKPVPEPGSVMLLGTTLIGVIGLIRRRKFQMLS
jgi:uncharacterized protein (TIGR03118 family)